ncbi:dihydroxyacetone kinase subunit DhaK [Jiangella asiatica]|uniref:Dihydroxyacetone kinase subunit DhaK n=1 Tax=Jiangella asiatica TaxID=2530372 RepID=A0A4R5CRF2_9ACTN|nr:dihydroxyacetone kinase subunit DhaK [Jiangella asiatica]TDE03122.1 dihydroxyacetone kinase subunit DhaK [Jiangella asiatica]
MRKLINDPADFVDQMLTGIELAHPGRLRRPGDEAGAIVRADADFAGRVTIATGGGSGHLPLFLGYVGPGLADGCAVGQVFASPSTDQMLAVTRAIHGGRGVLYVYGNYSGDRMNFELAADLARAEGIEVETAVAADDVASAPADRAQSRRGIAGIYFAYRVAGAAAATGADLPRVAAAARSAIARTRSMGVALAPCVLPAVGHANFDIPAGTIEVGMGIHGEPGVGREELRDADAVVDDLVDRLLADAPADAGDQVAVLVNGLGATCLEELYIVYRRVHERLAAAGLDVAHRSVGEYATSLEMAGASISLLFLDDELAGLVTAPASSPLVLVP